MKELERVYLNNQTDEGDRDKTFRETEKKREEHIQPPAKKFVRLPPKPMAGTAKPAVCLFITKLLIESIAAWSSTCYAKNSTQERDRSQKAGRGKEKG